MAASIGLWIALLSGLAWSGLDVSRKSLTTDCSAPVIAAGLSLGSAILFGLAAASGPYRMDLRTYLVPGTVSIVLSIATQILILESVRRSELSRTIPLLSFTPVVTALFGVAVLDEWPSESAWLGIVLVFAGAFALGLLRGGRSAGVGAPLLALDPGALSMVMAAICISAAAPFDKLAIRASTTPVHGCVQGLGGALVLGALLAFRGETSKLAGAFRRRPAMTVAVLLAFAAIGLQFVAYRTAMVGEVETIKRAVGLVVSLTVGWWAFGERVTVSKVIAVGALGAGTALILLGPTT